MDNNARTAEDMRERSRRSIRNKRYSRRIYGEEKRPPKRLFTPEIKRFLKDWLVRRRDNPYPNRDEKKTLAVQTGLTYIQVCNWFANWRRKLKNAGTEPQKKTWGNLIKTYNSQVQGNVEHFSICSEDSIWEETEGSSTFEDEPSKPSQNYCLDFHKKNYTVDHSYTYENRNNNNIDFTISNNNNNNDIQNQCYYVSSTTEVDMSNPFAQPANKYKSHIMEKYLRDCQQPPAYVTEVKADDDVTKPSMITKWLESAANFKPNENSYLDWTLSKTNKKKTKNVDYQNMNQLHGKAELDAAEALTTLANARLCNL